MALGAIVGGLITGGLSAFGASSSNSAARKAASRQNKYNKEMYVYQWDEDDGQMFWKYRHDLETVNIQKQNHDIQLRLTEQKAADRQLLLSVNLLLIGYRHQLCRENR